MILTTSLFFKIFQNKRGWATLRKWGKASPKQRDGQALGPLLREKGSKKQGFPEPEDTGL